MMEALKNDDITISGTPIYVLPNKKEIEAMEIEKLNERADKSRNQDTYKDYNLKGLQLKYDLEECQWLMGLNVIEITSFQHLFFVADKIKNRLKVDYETIKKEIYKKAFINRPLRPDNISDKEWIEILECTVIEKVEREDKNNLVIQERTSSLNDSLKELDSLVKECLNRIIPLNKISKSNPIPNLINEQ